jgi:hypothetical protein
MYVGYCAIQPGSLGLRGQLRATNMVATSSIDPGVGRPSSYKPEFAKMVRHLCKLGATDADLADAFEVSVVTIDNWKIRYPQFLGSLKGKATNGRAVALQTRHWLER